MDGFSIGATPEPFPLSLTTYHIVYTTFSLNLTDSSQICTSRRILESSVDFPLAQRSAMKPNDIILSSQLTRYCAHNYGRQQNSQFAAPNNSAAFYTVSTLCFALSHNWWAFLSMVITVRYCDNLLFRGRPITLDRSVCNQPISLAVFTVSLFGLHRRADVAYTTYIGHRLFCKQLLLSV